jgi:hypothetical protein
MDPDGVPVLDKFCLLLEEGGYGTYEMLRKGLMIQSGNAGGIRQRGAVQNQPRPKIKKKRAGKDHNDGQMTMF